MWSQTTGEIPHCDTHSHHCCCCHNTELIPVSPAPLSPPCRSMNVASLNKLRYLRTRHSPRVLLWRTQEKAFRRIEEVVHTSFFYSNDEGRGGFGMDGKIARDFEAKGGMPATCMYNLTRVDEGRKCCFFLSIEMKAPCRSGEGREERARYVTQDLSFLLWEGKRE